MARTASLFDLQLIGDERIARHLRRLSDSEIKKINTRASNKALTPASRAVKNKIRSLEYNGEPMDGRKDFAKAIRRKSKSYRRGHIKVRILGAKDERDAKGRNWSKLVHLIERGTKAHSLVKKGGLVRTAKRLFTGKQHPGLPPRPVMRQAYDENRHRMAALWRQDVGVQLNQYWSKIKAAKGGK